MKTEPTRTCPVLDPTGADVHGEAARLRAEGPATRVLLPGGVPAWSITRHEQIRFLTGDARVSRDAYRHWPALASIPADWPLNMWIRIPTALTSYGAEHRRLRALIATAFTPRRTRLLRPLVAATVDTLIRDLANTPPGTVIDLRARYAYRIPSQVICDLFGVPDSMRAKTLRLLDTAMDTNASGAKAMADFIELQAHMRKLIAVKIETPGEDLTTDLIAARDHDDRLTEDEVAASLILMIGAGAETAVNLIGTAALALLTHPEQHARFRAETLSVVDVIEETLRLQSPAMHVPLRYALDDIDLGEGVVIRKGDAIIVCFGAVGRDPALHGDTAERFDPDRPDKTHLAFGHGVHYCLGAPLARMEAELALTALFTRFPGLALAVPPDELRPLESFIANGHREIPVRLGFAAPPG